MSIPLNRSSSKGMNQGKNPSSCITENNDIDPPILLHRHSSKGMNQGKNPSESIAENNDIECPQDVKRGYTYPMLSTHTSMLFVHGQSGVWGGFFNYTNVTIGAGMVGLPYACE